MFAGTAVAPFAGTVEMTIGWRSRRKGPNKVGGQRSACGILRAGGNRGHVYKVLVERTAVGVNVAVIPA